MLKMGMNLVLIKFKNLKMPKRKKFDPDRHLRNYRNRPPHKKMNFYTFYLNLLPPYN
jgi:hypothetical protein